MPANDGWKEYESCRHHDALPRLRKAETADTRRLNQKYGTPKRVRRVFHCKAVCFLENRVYIKYKIQRRDKNDRSKRHALYRRER